MECKLAPEALKVGGGTLGSSLRTVDPCQYPHWDELLETRGDASIFHSSGWARVLVETYGHRPFYFCRIEAGRLKELLPVMEVNSRWTGRRGVALPFTDFVPPLRDESHTEQGLLAGLYEAAVQTGRERGWRYFECRGDHREWRGASPSLVFHGHSVDLSRSEANIFENLDGAVRRAIRKAEQNKVTVEFDQTAEGMRIYYRLHCATRRRHGVPPQPLKFFENIAQHLLEQKRGFIAIARHHGNAIAAAVFFHFGREGIYKFGASDFTAQQLRPNNLVMWEATKKLASNGCRTLRMGRTSVSNEGLRRFKLGFGAQEEMINYARFDFRKNAFITAVDRAETWMNYVFRVLPGRVFRLAGATLYPHLS